MKKSAFNSLLQLLAYAFSCHVFSSENTPISIKSSHLSEHTLKPKKSHSTETIPKLMLANKYDRSVNLSDYWVSEKLDGVRCYWDGQQLWTRGGQRIQAPKRFTDSFPREALDGELWVGYQQFEAISSLARRQHSQPLDWEPVKFFLFDLPSSPLPFNQRLAKLEQLVQALALPQLAMVPHFKVKNHSELMQKMQTIVKNGGEGLMLHKATSLYRGFRSNDLLKAKPYLDDEAIVIAHIPGRGRHKGRLGSLLVKHSSGTEFKVGTGFSDLERENPPPIGSEITYRYFGKTKTGKPKFASFMRVHASVD